MLEEKLSEEDCKACRKCCKFYKEDLVDAPLFTHEQYLKAKQLFIHNAQFKKIGDCYQIELIPISNSDQCICPILDEDTGCRLKNHRPFDCLSWPFYIMNKDNQLIIALSKDCPVISSIELLEIKEFVARSLKGPLIETAMKYPEMVALYRDNLVIVEALDIFINVDKK